jgi:cystathionine beta-lyase
MTYELGLDVDLLFDGRPIDRRCTDSAKWNYYPEDVIPLWVADMDFASPEPVIHALRERVEHGIFGYGMEPPELRSVLVARLERLYGWHVDPEALVFLPGVIAGFNRAVRAVNAPADGILAQTPVYHPILHVPEYTRCTLDAMELTQRPDGQYEVDLSAFEAAITDRTRIFILCNPHNPVGRVFRSEELGRMAEICLRHGLIICSDEIHCDLVFAGHEHVPIASLAPEIAQRSITLMAPSKTYNIAGLHCSVAVIPDKELREAYCAAGAGLVPRPGVMDFVAALAAYQHGQPWLDGALSYLEANRDFLADYVASNLPGVAMAKPEGTYLAWLDCRQAGIPGSCHKFFLEKARVAMNDGAMFGRGGSGFVRLNFGCHRSTLVAALERMRQALLNLATG